MKPISLAVIGSGMMGGGIALDAARHGLTVKVYDARPEGAAQVRERAASVYGRWVKSGRMTEEAREAALGRISAAASLADLAGTDVIVEAVFEDLAVKRDVFAALAPHVGADTIVATNTSALRVADIAQGLPFAERVLGLHYFSPAEICPLVEVVRAAGTSEETLARAAAFLTATGRTALACADEPGFAINRFFCPYYNEATRILADGIATAGEIDTVARERLGIAAGPFLVMNLIGPRIASHAMANLAPLGPFYAASPLLMAQGRAGTAWETIPDARLPARADEIADRLVAAMGIPALELAAAGVADPAQTDTGAVMALKFGKGPFALMREWPQARLSAAIAALCGRDGHPEPRLAVAEPA
ncbi:MAG: 3-hydroxybutyryl-CoA dehydrogenase [Rhizobiales bacterium]|nr:3-hydroxybutyryl-CoA dehydrogenase [Hyphomicrobiales bacterium]